MEIMVLFVAILLIACSCGEARRPAGKIGVRKWSLNMPATLPKLPPLFSSQDGSFVPPTPPSDDSDAMAGEDDSERQGGANPLTALGIWLTGGIDKYNALLEKHPVATKLITSGVLGGLGDIVSQKLSGKDAAIDMRRLFMFTVAAAFYFAPVIGAWFSLLNSLTVPGGAGAKAVMMIAIDQTLGAVSVIGTYFFFYELLDHIVPGGSACAEGQNPIANVWNKGSNSFVNVLPGVLVANWKLWPVVNFLNFRYVAPNYQLLVSNLVSFFWNIYLAGATANK